MITLNPIKGTNIFIYEKDNALSSSSGSSSPMISLSQGSCADSSDSDISSPRISSDELSDGCYNSSSNCEKDISASFKSSLFVGGDEENHTQENPYGQSKEESMMRPPDYLPLDYFHNQLIQGGGAFAQNTTKSSTKGFGLTKSEQEFKDLIQRFPVSKSMEDLAAKSAGIDLFTTTPEVYSHFNQQQQQHKTQQVKREFEDLCVVNSTNADTSSAFYIAPATFEPEVHQQRPSIANRYSHQPPPPSISHGSEAGLMEKFTDVRVTDFKHVIYNLLVDNYNDSIRGHPDPNFISIVEPAIIEDGGVTRHGFTFRDEAQPERILPELYSTHIRNAPLENEDPSSIFIQDLYKYYLRSCVELLSKYFEKKGRYTFLYEDVPLFIPGSSLRDAEKRMKLMKTRARMQKKRKNSC